MPPALPPGATGRPLGREQRSPGPDSEASSWESALLGRRRGARGRYSPVGPPLLHTRTRGARPRRSHASPAQTRAAPGRGQRAPKLPEGAGGAHARASRRRERRCGAGGPQVSSAPCSPARPRLATVRGASRATWGPDPAPREAPAFCPAGARSEEKPCAPPDPHPGHGARPAGAAGTCSPQGGAYGSVIPSGNL